MQGLVDPPGITVTAITFRNLRHPYVRPFGLDLTAYDLARAFAEVPFDPATPPGTYRLALGGPQPLSTETLDLVLGLRFTTPRTLCRLAPGAALDLEFVLAAGQGQRPAEPPTAPNQVTFAAHFTPLPESREKPAGSPAVIRSPSAGLVEEIRPDAIVVAGHEVEVAAFEVDEAGDAVGWRIEVAVGSHVAVGEAIATLPAVGAGSAPGAGPASTVVRSWTAPTPRRRLLTYQDHRDAMPARELAGDGICLDRFGVVKPESLIPSEAVLIARRLADRDRLLRAPAGGPWVVTEIVRNGLEFTLELWSHSG